jgi:hypothetical protein
MRKKFIVVLPFVMLGWGRPEAATTASAACRDADQEIRTALSAYIAYNYPGGGTTSEDMEEVASARKLLIHNGDKALPCLEEIYQFGLTRSDLWKGEGSAPSKGDWTLPLIGAISPVAAIPLYRELLAATTDSLSRVRLNAEIAILGDESPLRELAAFLATPPKGLAGESKSDLIMVQEKALVAVSVHNYGAALPALRRMREQWLYPHLVDVYIAQLEKNVPKLQELAAQSNTMKEADLALKRLGRDDILRGIAGDRAHAGRAMAAAVIANEITQ